MARRDVPRFHGFLIVDKPAGMTSHDVVGRVRRLTGQRTVGHAGTLDPAATGVLPVALGMATKALPFAGDSSKTYRAEITFGIETDTLDADGIVTTITGQTPSIDDLAEILPRYVGDLQQVPPQHSAIQIDGRRLYELARAGIAFEPPPRQVVIHQIEIVDYQAPVLTVCVDCGAGTYIRSLARDIGRDTGCGAYLSDLVRLRSGAFDLEDAWTVEELAIAPIENEWPVIAYHPDRILDHLPAAILDASGCERWMRGQPNPAPHEAPVGHIRAYTVTGDWVGIGEIAEQIGGKACLPRRVIAQTLADGATVGQR